MPEHEAGMLQHLIVGRLPGTRRPLASSSLAAHGRPPPHVLQFRVPEQAYLFVVFGVG